MTEIAVPQVPFTTACFRDSASGVNYALVQCANHVESVVYTVYDGCCAATDPGTRRLTGTAGSSNPGGSIATEGEQRTGITFSFPVQKGTTYFIVAELTYDEEHGGTTQTLHWSVDPNKRRTGAKRKRASATDGAASPTPEAVAAK